MAIYIDGVQLVPKATGTSMEKKYYNDLQELKKLFDKFRRGTAPATLLFKREWARQWNEAKTSWKPCPPMAIPLRASYYDSGFDGVQGSGAIDIRYSASPPDKVSGKLRWNKSHEMIYEIYTVDEKHSDLAWFFFKASNFFEKGVLKLIDEEVEIQAKWDTVALQADVAIALRNISEDELAQVYVYFLGGIFSYDEAQPVKANSMRIWDLAILQAKNGNTEAMNSLKQALDKVVKSEPVAKDGSIIIDGTEYPILPLPEGWTLKNINQEAENYGIELPKKILKNEIKYSILMAKKQLLETT